MNEIERSEAVKIILERNPSAFDTKFLIVSQQLWCLIAYHVFTILLNSFVFIFSTICWPRKQLIRAAVNVGKACVWKNIASATKL